MVSMQDEDMRLRIASAIAEGVSDGMVAAGYTEAGAQYVYDRLVDALMQESWEALHEIGRELELVRLSSQD